MSTTVETKPVTGRELVADGSAPNSLGLRMLPLARIHPSGFNPRKDFSSVDELAISVKELGVLQSITLRVDPNDETQYEILAGECRYRAAKVAGLVEIPANVVEADERRARIIAVTENGKRKDVNAMEIAGGYKQLADLGMTQEEIAEECGVGRSSVANALRLLELPKPVQGMVAGGALKMGHGVALLRFKAFPKVLTAMAEHAHEKGVSQAQLETGDIPYWDLARGKHIRVIEDGSIAANCKASCPFGAYFRSTNYQSLCLMQSHLDQLLAERKSGEVNAVVEAQAKDREKLEIARQAVVDARKAVAAAATPALTRKAEKTVERLVVKARMIEHAVEPPLNLVGRPSSSYIQIRNAPAGCTKGCPCRRNALCYGSKCQACTNPDRYRDLGRVEAEKQEASVRSRFDASLYQVLCTADGGGMLWREDVPARQDFVGVIVAGMWTMPYGKHKERFQELCQIAGLPMHPSFWSYDTKLERERGKFFRELPFEQLMAYVVLYNLAREEVAALDAVRSRNSMPETPWRDLVASGLPAPTLMEVFADGAPAAGDASDVSAGDAICNL